MLHFYTLSFLFTEDRRRVLLCRKNRPKWQAGRLNAIGGKVEVGEKSYDAHIREFCEETGISELHCRAINWKHFANYGSNDWQLACYRGFSDRVIDLVPGAEPDQPTLLYPVNKLHKDMSPLPNVPWLAMMALIEDPMWDTYEVRSVSSCYAH